MLWRKFIKVFQELEISIKTPLLTVTPSFLGKGVGLPRFNELWYKWCVAPLSRTQELSIFVVFDVLLATYTKGEDLLLDPDSY